MESVSKKNTHESNFPNLKRINKDNVRQEVPNLLARTEQIVCAFQTVRDQVVFTNKRIITINIQSVTGTKKTFYSYPYSRVQYYGIETAGVLDVDSELILSFADGIRLALDFVYKENIEKICALISNFIL